MIRLENVTKCFGIGNQKICAISGTTLVIPKSRLVYVTGKNGAGKTTLILLMSGLLSPTNGRVLLEGRDISLLPEKMMLDVRRKKIGVIFQERFLLPQATVMENLALPLIPMNLTANQIKKSADRVLEEFDLIHKKKMLCRNLSGGEKQRLMIARALINDPDIIFADEPTTHLDHDILDIFKHQMVSWIHAQKTVVVATHQDALLNTSMDPVHIHLEHGKLTEQHQ